MALIICPDCEKQISDLAPSCPHCGRPNSTASRREPGLAHGHKANLDVEFAGFWLRAAAFLVDAIVLWVPASLFRWTFPGSQQSTEFQVLDFVQSMVICTLYYSFMESSQHQGTLGKIALGLKVVDIHGKRLSLAHAATRYLSQFLSAIICGVGFLMAGWTEKKQALHDMITDCLVVKASR